MPKSKKVREDPKTKDAELGPIVQWEFEPKAESTKGGGGPKLAQELRFAERLPDSRVTAAPMRQTHEAINDYGGYVARRHPGAE